MNRARSLICSAHLPRDLFAERHAGYKIRRARLRMKGRGLPRPGRHKGWPNTGDPSAGDQSITRGIGGGRALPLSDIFLAAVVPGQPGDALAPPLAPFLHEPPARV